MVDKFCIVLECRLSNSTTLQTVMTHSQTHLQHVAVIVLDPHLPEALQGQHAANAHLMEHLLYHVWKGTCSKPSLPVHRHPQHARQAQVMLMDQVGQGLQHALLGRLKASVGQDGGHWLIEEWPAGGPTQLCDRLAFTPKNGKNQKRSEEMKGDKWWLVDKMSEIISVKCWVMLYVNKL